MYRLTIRKGIAGIIIPAAMVAGLVTAVAVSSGHVFAYDGVFMVSQGNDELDRDTYSQSYTMSYFQSDVLEEDKKVRLVMSLDDDFIPETLTLGEWEGYDGSFSVAGYLDSGEVFNETVDGGSVIDLTAYGTADEIHIESDGLVERTAGFSGTAVEGHIADSFSEMSMSGYFYYYIGDGEDDFVLAGSEVTEMSGYHFYAGKPVAAVDTDMLDYGSSARMTISDMLLDGDSGLNYYRTYIHVPYGTQVSSVTLPVFENASVALYVDGEPVQAEGGTAQVGAAVSEMYLEVTPVYPDTAQTSDMYVDFVNMSAEGGAGEAYARSVVNYGRNVSTYTESDHTGITLLPAPEDTGSGDTGNAGETGDAGSGTDAGAQDTSGVATVTPSGDTETGTSGQGSSVSVPADSTAGSVTSSSQGTEEAAGFLSGAGDESVAGIVTDLTGLGLDRGVLITADSGGAAVTVSGRSSLLSSMDIDDDASSRVETAEVEAADAVSGAADTEYADDAEPVVSGAGGEEDSSPARALSGNFYRVAGVGAAAALAVVITGVTARHRKRKRSSG